MAESIRSICDAALRKLGLVGAGEQADPNEFADALSCLRMMLDTWSTQDLLIPFTITEEFDLEAGKAHYSMGLDGDWPAVRPEAIEFIRIREGETTFPVRRAAQNELVQRSTVERGRPTCFLASADGLYAYVEFDREPEGGVALVTSLKPFNVAALDNFDKPFTGGDPEVMYPSGMTLTGIQTPITFPSGYWSAIVHNLAVWLAPEYPGTTISPVVAGLAAEGTRLIKRRNQQPLVMLCDPVLLRGAYQ